MDKPNIPALDINNINRIINKLESIDIEKESIENITILISELMSGYSLSAYTFPVDCLFLYRGIKYEGKPISINDIIYPPKNIAKINRASNVEEQMFYASTSKRAVLYELKVQPNDKLIIAEWNINNSLLFNCVGYTKTNFEALGSSRPVFLNLDVQKDVTYINQFIADYLAKSFCQDISEENNYLYKLTNAIASIHLKTVHDYMFSGLCYPTIKLNANEDNFAIKKDTIDLGLLDFINISFIEIIDYDDKRYQYRILDYADTITNGIIDWKNFNKEWTVFDNSEELYFVDENNDIKAYNSSGEEISPD